MAVNWSILANAPDPGNAFAQGFQNGQALAKQHRVDNALRSYATNPDDPNAAHSLLAVDPRLGLQIMQDQRERRQHAELLAIRQRAASGDHGAINELFARDPESWGRLDTRTREQVKQATSFMGNAVLQISRLPEAARPQAWAHYVQQAEASGLDIPPQYERYSPEALNSAAAEANMTEKLIQQFEPKYQAVAPGGTLQNTNPLAGTVGATANIPQIHSEADVAALPDGAQFVAPDGSIRRKGGATATPSPTFP